MKKGFTLIPIFCLLMAGMKVSASIGQPLTEKSNYVVIGAFSIPRNAEEFTENAKKNKFDAQFSINPARKLFYVFVLHTGNLQSAFEEAKRLRKESPYYDTWVFSGVLGEDEKKGDDLNPITGKGIQHIQPSDPKEVAKNTAQPDQPNQPNTIVPEVNNTVTTANTAQPNVEQNNTNTPSLFEEEIPEGSKKFLFKIAAGEKEIGGDIDVMDLDKNQPRKVASYRGNEVVNVKPANKSGNVSFVCEVFGYRKVQQPVNFNDPIATEGVVVDENKITVPFSLTRLKKGDIAVMYNVYFFKDAAIMRPESKYEVTSLLEMLQENPKYKIKIHGHTNGNASGKIISMGASKNFFALTDTKDGYGSAKKLSEERAKVIQSYLIAQGINPSRMHIKAWGGKRPVYDIDSPQARANVRVEIEILED
ncbi:MAG: OmpA family protein [Bacteroidetes bacterium]|nr:OmpA family protein [Bacteroidota bacterium]